MRCDRTNAFCLPGEGEDSGDVEFPKAGDEGAPKVLVEASEEED